MLRSWNAYKTYAWGKDVLLPLSKSGFNWYEHSLGISPIDAYSTLSVMGLKEEAKEIENYALKMNWDKDVYVQVFEVNIRILGGLLAIYDITKNPDVLSKAIDFGDRLLPAFNSPTGIPYHSVNLKTGKTSGNHGKGSGNIVNTAQAATYLFEFGILSYYSQNPKYYQAAKKATMAVFKRKSNIGFPGDLINVESGEWTNNWSYLQAGMDSYYEYLFKSNLLFPDPEIEKVWEYSIAKINQYYSDDYNGRQFYACVNMETGEIVKQSMSLYDAFFSAIQALHGDIENAENIMATWDWLWDKYGLLPTRYLYCEDKIEYGNSELNPEIIESAYYLHQITGKEKYLKMIQKYWSDIKSCCMNEIAFHAVSDVRTMKEKDYIATYFCAETLKYFYLASVNKDVFNFNEYVFNTEAHPFLKNNFKKENVKTYLGIK
ncbi:alpha-mannosidase/ calcium ion binding / mannosyl-oligosaccharide 1,2-alpha-mannosidase [Winogradskyella sp. PG-2]|nr:alpha-mannosidase/ calcium ion binding / mannosyl-oligosaccharide 1,2-alpha-mannosidase [Winogradskyella sp. PG-2]